MQSHPLQPSAARGCTHAGCRTAARSLLIIARELRPPRAQSYGLTPQTPKPTCHFSAALRMLGCYPEPC